MTIKTHFSHWLTFFMFAVAAALALSVKANTRSLPQVDSRLVSENRFHVVENDDGPLEAIAKKHNVGFLALLQVNPGADPYMPRMDSVLAILSQTLFPDASREGIVINIAELCLYYYPSGKNSVIVYPIDIGQLGGGTLMPTMVTTVSDKCVDPTWTSTVNIHVRCKAQRTELSAVVPARPDNLMGHRAIRLTVYGGVYLLRGMNADFDTSIRVNSGCIRLRGDDTKTSPNQVVPGTKVNITNTPTKVPAEPNGACLVEVHQPLFERIDNDPQLLLITLNSIMQSFKDAVQTDIEVMQHVMDVCSGMPVDVRRHQVNPQTL